MNTVAEKATIKTITAHYIDEAFVEPQGREVMDIIRPTDRQVIGRVTLADETDTRHAIAAAKRAFATYGRSTPEERVTALHRSRRRKGGSGNVVDAPMGQDDRDA